MTHTIVTAVMASEQRADYLDRLGGETLPALMRSTWTWDDRALRRRLSQILVGLAAVRELRVGIADCPAPVIEAAECGVLATAGEFIAEVLGPRLLADAGNPFRDPFLPLVSATSGLVYQAEQALNAISVEVTGHVIERNESLSTILPEAVWSENSSSARGLAQVAYSAGFTLSSTDYFASAGLAAQAYSVASPSTRDSADLRKATLAAAEESGSWDPALVRTRASSDGNSWMISGEKWFVPSAVGADTILTIARTVGGPSLYLVEASAPGVSISSLATLDADRPLARVAFDDTPAVMVGREGAGGQVMNRTVDRGTTALAAEQVGLVDRALKTLSQLPPSCGDSEAWRRYTSEIAAMEVLRWSATALLLRAIKLQGDNRIGESSVASAMAHIGCSSAARSVSRRLRTAGSSEFDPTVAQAIGLRVQTTDLLLGGPTWAHERLLERLGI